MRIVASGYPILLVPEAQGTHLKDWTARQVWRTDILRRGVPWSRLIAEGQRVGADLNIAPGERANAALALAMIPAAMLSVVWPQLAVTLVVMAVGYIAGNHRFFGFLAGKLPLKVLVTAIAMHWCYHVYASATFAFIVASEWVSRRVGGHPTRLSQ